MSDRKCPECSAGKCINCTHQRWDGPTDSLAPCECRSLVHAPAGVRR